MFNKKSYLSFAPPWLRRRSHAYIKIGFTTRDVVIDVPANANVDGGNI